MNFSPPLSQPVYTLDMYVIKVGISCMAISEPCVQINGQLRSLHNYQQRSNCSYCLKMPLNSNLRPSNWKFEPPSRPHPHFDPIIDTHTQRDKNYIRIIIAYIGVKATDLNLLSQWKTRIWLPEVSKIHTYPLKLSPYKTMYFPQVREFGHKSTPSDRPWIEAYCPKF